LPHILTAKEIQEFLNVSKGKAYELFKEEGFPTISIGSSKRVYRDDFIAWVDKQRRGVK
jgi:excisionase family DNA binding protein